MDRFQAHPILNPQQQKNTHTDREATEYLRAVMAAGETSERALGLTAEVIEMNAAHYTAWWVGLGWVGGMIRLLCRRLAFYAHQHYYKTRMKCRYYRRRCLEALVTEVQERRECRTHPHTAPSHGVAKPCITQPRVDIHHQATEEAAYRQELGYTARVAVENPKNYQVWCVRVGWFT